MLGLQLNHSLFQRFDDREVLVHHEISGERITRQPEPRRAGIRARNIGILLQPCRIDRALIAHRLCPQVSESLR